jgi:hypothetical protein
MQPSPSPPERFIGLDLHKSYLVATGVNAAREKVYGPKRVALAEAATWIARDLTTADAVVVEMTTNTWTMVDMLEPPSGTC